MNRQMTDTQSQIIADTHFASNVLKLCVRKANPIVSIAKPRV